MNVRRLVLLTVLSLCTKRADAFFFDFLCFIPFLSWLFPFCNDTIDIPTDAPTDAPVTGGALCSDSSCGFNAVCTDVAGSGFQCECEPSFLGDDPTTICDTCDPEVEGACVTDEEKIQAFQETGDAIEEFNFALQAYVEGIPLDEDQRRLFFAAIARAAAKFGAKFLKPVIGKALKNKGTIGTVLNTALSFIGLGFDVAGAVGPSQVEVQILDELTVINGKLDDIESQLRQGFVKVEELIDELADDLNLQAELRVANGKLSDINLKLSNLEVEFQDFTRPGQSNAVRAENKERFRTICNNDPGNTPEAIFRELYSFVCTTCDNIDGGQKDIRNFDQSFFERADGVSLTAVKGFRQGFGAIMLSTMARAMVMHNLCLPLSDNLVLSDDPGFLERQEQMTASIEEVALALEDAEPKFFYPLFLKGRSDQTCLRGTPLVTPLFVGFFSTIITFDCDDSSPENLWQFTPDGRIRSKLDPLKCLGETSDGDITLRNCGDAPPSNQLWSLGSDGLIRSGAKPDHCFTVVQENLKIVIQSKICDPANFIQEFE